MDTSLIGAYLYIPGNLDYKKVLREFPPQDHGFPGRFDEDYMLYILSRIVEASYLDPDSIDDDGFVMLKAEYLRNVVRLYAQYIDYLVAAKVIVVDLQFIRDKKSRGYAFHKPYHAAPGVQEIPIKITSRLYKHIAKRNLPLTVSKEVWDKYPYLAKWLNADLKMLPEPANRIITLVQWLRLKEKDDIMRFLFYSTLVDDLKSRTRVENKYVSGLFKPFYNYQLGLLTMIKQRWFASIDDTVHRLHTNITNLKSELRHCLRYQGKELVCVDIKNSQPYLSILLLNPLFYEREQEWLPNYIMGRKETGQPVSSEARAGKLYPLSPIIVKKQVGNPRGITVRTTGEGVLGKRGGWGITTKILEEDIPISLSSFKSIYSSLQNTSSLSRTITVLVSDLLSGGIETASADSAKKSDLELYITHAAKGTLYEYIRTELEARGLPVPAHRKDLKAMVFQVLFTDNRFKGVEEAAPKRMFAELFPTVTKVFEYIKTGANERLPILLQQLESKLFLDIITKRISEERPDLPIFTIHDSIMTIDGEQAYVARVIKEECRKVIGIAPEVSIEPYTNHSILEVEAKLEKEIAKANDMVTKVKRQIPRDVCDLMKIPLSNDERGL